MPKCLKLIDKEKSEVLVLPEPTCAQMQSSQSSRLTAAAYHLAFPLRSQNLRRYGGGCCYAAISSELECYLQHR